MKKIILTVFAASSLLLYSTPGICNFKLKRWEFHIGAYIYRDQLMQMGIKMRLMELSGYFVQIGVPIAFWPRFRNG